MHRTALMLMASLALATATPAAAETIAFTHATVLDMRSTAPLADHTVLVRDGRIEQVGPSARVILPAGTRVIDATGQWLMPALWDMHVHIANRDEAGLEAGMIAPLLLAHGVVGVRDMGSDPARVRALRDSIAASRWRAPEVLSPGPFVDGAAAEAGPLFVPVANDSAARAAVRALQAKGADFIKIQAGLSREALHGVNAECTRLGIRFAGHVPEALTAGEVLAANAHSLEHISPTLPGDAGVMRACTGHEDSLIAALAAFGDSAARPGADRTVLRRQQAQLQEAHIASFDDTAIRTLARSVRARGAALCPTLVWSASFRPLDAGDSGAALPLEYVPRSIRERALAGRRRVLAGTSEESFTLNRRMAQRSAELVGRLHREGASILAGTDSFDAFCLPGVALHQELEQLVAAGLSPLAALQAATREPARFLSRLQRAGTVERGKRADLLLLTADPLADIRNTRRIARVVAGGRVLERADLDALLAGVRAYADAH